jgi:hypothetical protein
VATFFSRATLGLTEMTVAGSSIVQRGDYVGSGAADCFLPIALPDCYFDQDDDGIENMVLKLQPAGIDNAGWGRMNAAWDNTYNKAQITDNCSSGTGYVGDQVFLGNGIATSSLKELDDALEGSSTTWDASTYGDEPDQLCCDDKGKMISTLKNFGNTLEGPIILFDDDSYCTDADGDGKFDGGSFNGNKTTTGFAWGVIFDVSEKGDAATRNFQMHIDMTGEHHVGSSGGGGNYNVTFIGNSKEVR